MGILHQRNITLLCLLLSLIALPLAVAAQPGMIVKRYTMEDGLPSNTVYSSVKDRDGFVWFGTWHGLCSFDGVEFTPYSTRSDHLSDVPPQKVRNIVEDKDGYLWIRDADKHLYVFDRKTEEYHNIYNELKRLSRNVQVISIDCTDDGQALILTRNHELLVAKVGAKGKTSVSKLYDVGNNIDPSTMKLKRNILGETAKYVYWVSTSSETKVMTKKDGRSLLAGMKGGGDFTCCHTDGRYLCVGTSRGAIYVADTGDGSLRRYKPDTPQPPVTGISIVGNQIYFTTPKGLYSLTSDMRPRQVSTRGTGATKLFADCRGRLWLCSTAGSMVCHDHASGDMMTFDMPRDSLFANMKFVDTDANGLFILQRNGEVWHFDHTTKVMSVINRMSEFSDKVEETHFFDIDVDANGIMWLSSTTSGAFKVCFPKSNFNFMLPDLLGNTGFSLIRHEKARAEGRADVAGIDGGIRALYLSRGGELWVGTRGGDLYCLDHNTLEVKRRFGAADIGVVYHIMEDDRGNFWFSTKGSGLVRGTPDALSPNGLRLTRYVNKRGDRNSISSNRVYYTYQDSRKRIWVCTFSGGLNLMEKANGNIVFRHRRNGMTSYPKYELCTDVRIITEDSSGRMWVGTTDGLMSFDGNFGKTADIRFETYRDRNSSGVTSNDISTIYKDSKGRIWMGIFGNGLNLLERYDSRNHRPVLRSFAANDRQDANVITSIIEDKDNCLWVGTEYGLAGLKQGSSYLKAYDRFAGFPMVTMEDNTAVCMTDGRILMGCRQGLLEFDPAAVRSQSEHGHNTFITDFKVMNRSVGDFDPPIYKGSLKYAEEIVLSHNQGGFTIEFTSPCYAGNSLQPYAYMLDGYEDQWHSNGSNRIASYANVPPGRYKFRVKVDDNESPERVLAVTILPPWWATWWAYLIYIVAAALLLYGVARTVIYVIRMRNEVYINDRLAELKIRFFTNVSHELRTPLSLIKGPVEELKTNEKLSPTGKEYLNLIERNSRKMLQLVNQILDFRKVQNGRMRLHVSFVDITVIIETLMGEFRVLADERGISFTLNRPEGRAMAWCDAEKIGVVLNNLISNAFKYTDDGGTIAVGVSCDPGAKTCTITVADDGAGIPASQLGLIFERFSQADNKTSGDTTQAGTGIGLSLSKEYVNMHHGTIRAENIADGGGVVFTVELPTGKDHFNDKDTEVYFDDETAESGVQADAAEAADTAGNDADQSTADDVPTVILIEDNTDMCRMLKLQLGDRYNVVAAHDGREGLDKIYQCHPDIIITDLMMPGMSGLDLLRSIRQDFNISHIPVIILTAKNTEEDKMNSVKAGANAYITKPFSRKYLLARVAQLLEEQRIFQRKMVVQSAVDSGTDTSNDEYERHLVKKDIEFVHKIHEIIEQNLNANDFNIDTIAETIGLSRSAFFKKLKSLTGLAPVDLVREIRLNKAARQIETTDNSITEIAYAVGFHDVGYFGKCFRKKYGKSPKEYRNEIRNK